MGVKESNDERLAFNRQEYERRDREVFARFRYVGKVEPGDVLPAGRLYVDLESITVDGAGVKRVQLTLNLDQTLPAPGHVFDRGRSYVIAATMRCSSGALTIDSTTLATIEDGYGRHVAHERHSPPLAVDRPSLAMGSAVKRVCDD